MVGALVVGLLVGCGGSEPERDAGGAGDETSAVAGRQGAGGRSAPDDRRSPVGVPIDPAQARPGDTIAGLALVRLDASSTPDSAWVGSARFVGERALSGVWQRHFDWPEARFGCFHLDSASAATLPRWPGDQRKPWLCFEDLAAAESALGPAERARRARVVVDSLTINFSFSDVFNTASLVRVDSAGEETEPTLRTRWFGDR